MHNINKEVNIKAIMEENKNQTVENKTVKDEPAPAKTMSKKEKFRTSKLGEVFRFVIIGGLCTLIDLVVQLLLGFAFSTNLSTIGEWGKYVAIAIDTTVAFLISMIVNFIFSRTWVFQNVDKDKNYNTPKYFLVYAALATGGLALGVGLMVLGLYICDAAWGINLGLDPFNISIKDLFDKGGVAFWVYIAVFAVKTIIVLFYNYFTRKYLIFKEPKKKDAIDSASESVNKEVINLTYSDKSSAFVEKDKAPAAQAAAAESGPKPDAKPSISADADKEEKTESKNEGSLKTVYCKPQFNWGKPISKKKAKGIVYSSLEVYDPRKSSVTDVSTAKKIIVDEVLKDDKAAKQKKLK